MGRRADVPGIVARQLTTSQLTARACLARPGMRTLSRQNVQVVPRRL